MTYQDFRAWRKKRGMTQQSAADFLNLSIATIRAYEASPRRNAKARKIPVYLRRYIEALEAEAQLAQLRKELRQAKKT